MQEYDECSSWTPFTRLRERLLLPWPVEVYPEPFNNFVSELSRSTETPIELGASVLLAVVAAAAQKKYRVEVKPGYKEPVCVWPIAILQPGSRKSKVFSEMTIPLVNWEEGRKNELGDLIRSSTSRRKTMEVRIEKLRNQAAKGNDYQYKQLESEILNLELELPIIPSVPRIWASDVTPEELGNIMEMNDESMSVLSDEGGIFSILNGLYSRGEANLDLFLQGYSGSSVRVDRRSRPPIFMKEALLTMGLTIQPHVLKSICSNKNFRGRGLVGRAFFFFPDSNIGYRTLEESPMSEEIRIDFQSAITAILRHPYYIEDKKQPHVLSLEAEAFEEWKSWSKGIETAMKDGSGILCEIVDWASKLSGGIARIAGLIHIMRYSHGSPWSHKISKIDMKAAIKIGNVLMMHALKTFDLIGEDEAHEVAAKVALWIRTCQRESFTSRECLRKYRGIKKAQLTPGIELLVEHSIIRKKPSGASNEFEVNPYFLRDND